MGAWEYPEKLIRKNAKQTFMIWNMFFIWNDRYLFKDQRYHFI